MTSPERIPQAHSDDVIKYGDISVTIRNRDYIEQRLTEEGAYIPLFHGTRENLPSPCSDASISYHHDKDSDVFQLSGHITFDAPQDTGLGWQHDVLSYLEQQLRDSGAYTLELPHHTSTIYAPLDDTYMVKITTEEDTFDCTVAMSLEYYAHVREMLGGDPPQTLPKETPRYTLTRDFITQWNIALTTIKQLYQGSGGNSLVIHLPEAVTGGPSPEPAAIPERERITTPSEDQAKRFDDIGGATHAKARLQSIAQAFKYPEIAATYDIRPTHVLLYGPAGTGKTSLAEAFATEIGAELRVIVSSDIIGKYVGESGKNISGIFASAKAASQENPDQSIALFFDEFDSLGLRNTGSTSERVDVKNILKREIADLTANFPRIIVVAATNEDIADFDDALVRAGRLEPVYVGVPTEEERVEIWGLILAESITKLHAPLDPGQLDQPVAGVYGADIDPARLAALSDGFTGADIEQVLGQVRLAKFREAVQAGQPLPITHSDVLAAIRAYQKHS